MVSVAVTMFEKHLLFLARVLHEIIVVRHGGTQVLLAEGESCEVKSRLQKLQTGW